MIVKKVLSEGRKQTKGFGRGIASLIMIILLVGTLLPLFGVTARASKIEGTEACADTTNTMLDQASDSQGTTTTAESETYLSSEGSNDITPLWVPAGNVYGLVKYVNRAASGILNDVPPDQRWLPLRDARVRIFNVNPSGDDVDVTYRYTTIPPTEEYVYTNQNGYFYFYLDPRASIYSDQYYVKVYSESHYAEVKNNGVYTNKSDEITITEEELAVATEPTFEFIFTDYPDQPAWNILDSITEEVEWIKLRTGGWSRSKIDVYYPADPGTGNDGKYYYIIVDDIKIRDGKGWLDRLLYHEYGHAIMDGLFGTLPGGESQSSNLNEELTGGDASEDAFQEGWAEFMEAAIHGAFGSWDITNTLAGANLEYGSHHLFADIQPGEPAPHFDDSYGDYNDMNGNGIFDYDLVIGNNAGILWDVFDTSMAYDLCYPIKDNAQTSPYDDDGLSLGFDEIWDVMSSDNPYTVHDFWDGWFEQGYAYTNYNKHWIKAIYYNHGIKKDTGTYALPEHAPAPDPYFSPLIIISNPTNGYYSGNILMYVTGVSDSDTEDLSFLRCRFENSSDGGTTWNPISDTTSSSYYRSANWATTTVPNGMYQLRAVVDDDMIETKTIPVTVTIANVIPTTPSLLFPDNNAVLYTAQPAFDWSDCTVPYGDLWKYQIIVDHSPDFASIDYNWYVTGTPPTPPTSVYTPTSNMGDGYWHWKVRAQDYAGNWGLWSDYRSFKIATNKPTTPCLLSPSNGAIFDWVIGSNPTFDWTDSTAPPGKYISSYEIVLDDDPSFPIPSAHYDWTISGYPASSYYYPGINIPDGYWYWRVIAYDNFGVFSEWSSSSGFRMDTIEPFGPTSFTSDHAINVPSLVNTIYVTWSGAYDSGSGIYGYSIEWSTDPTKTPDNIVDTTQTFTSSPPLASGIWWLHIWTMDNAGIFSGTTNHVGPFIIDNLPPTINSISIQESSTYIHAIGSNVYYQPNFASVFTIVISASDPLSGLNRAVGSTAFGDTPIDTTPGDGLQLTYNIESGATQQQQIWVSVYDTVGNLITVVICVAPDATGPLTQLVSPPDAIFTSVNLPTLTWSSNDGQSGISGNYHLQVSTSPSFNPLIVDADISTTSLTFSTNLDDGLYYWRVKAQDNLGNWGDYPLPFTFTVDTINPIAIISSPLSGATVSEIQEITGIASGLNFKSYRVDIYDGTNNYLIMESETQQSNGILASWDTQNFVDGSYEIKILVKDKANNEATDTVNVNVDNSPHVILSSIKAHPDYFIPGVDTVEIKYEINEPLNMNLKIFDAQTSMEIKTLLDNVPQSKGLNFVYWNGKDNSGTPVGFGKIFRYEIQPVSFRKVSGIIHSITPDLKISTSLWSGYGPGPLEDDQSYCLVYWPEWNKCDSTDFNKYELNVERWIIDYYGNTWLDASDTLVSFDQSISSFVYLVTYPPLPPDFSPYGQTGQYIRYVYYFTLKEIGDSNEIIRSSNKQSIVLYPAFWGAFLNMWELYHIAGCPFLYVWNGTNYSMDNNILIDSEGNARPDFFVSDYYKVEQPITLSNGSYKLSIGEYENEHTYLNQAKLITVDHAQGAEIFVSENGTIYTSRNPIMPSSCYPEDYDINNITAIDDKYIEGGYDTRVIVDFVDEYDLENAKLLIRPDFKLGWGFKGVRGEDEPSGPIHIYAMIPTNGYWEYVTSINPRALWSTDIIDLSSFGFGQSSISFKLVWGGYHKIDYIALDTSEEEPVFVQELTPSSAIHSNKGVVTYETSLIDQKLIELIPGENLNLTFPYAPTAIERDFIFFTNGYYNTSNVLANLAVDKTEVLTGENVTFDASNSHDPNQDVISYYFDFGDGSNSGWVSSPVLTHQYIKGSRTYLCSLIVKNEESLLSMNSANVNISVGNKAPSPIFEVFQEANLTLQVAGRKDNTVTLQVYEDGILVNETSVTRQPGNPNEQAKTITMCRYLDYFDKNYTIMLVYDATHQGENPTTLTFGSGNNTLEYFITFNANNGYHQEIIIEPSYLKNVVQNNTLYYFDASNSYDIDGEIANYTWVFRDTGGYPLSEDIGYGVLVSHQYPSVDQYTVSLTITDDDETTISTKVTIFRDRLVWIFQPNPPFPPPHLP